MNLVYYWYESDEERDFRDTINKILKECGNDLDKLRATAKECDYIDKTIKDGETFYRIVLDKRFDSRLLLNFLELGADPCYIAPNGETALHNIFRYRHDIELIRKVLEKGANLNHENDDKKTAPECFTCIETLVDVEEAIYPDCPKTISERENFITELLSVLKEYKYDPAQRFSDNTSFLHKFCYFPKIAKEIAKISPDYRFDNGPTPLAAIVMLGCWIGDTPEGIDIASESAKILIDAGADVNAKSEQIIFYDEFAISPRHPKTIHPYTQRNQPMSLIHLACLHSAPSEVVKTLLDNGADVSCCKQEKNRTPLHSLVSNFICFPHGFNRRYQKKDEYQNIIKTMDYLLQAGVDINAQDNKGKTALHYIAEILVNINPSHTGWLLRLYENLLDRGADFNIKDNQKRMPEDIVPNKHLKEPIKEAQEKQKYNRFVKEYMEQELETFDR